MSIENASSEIDEEQTVSSAVEKSASDWPKKPHSPQLRFKFFLTGLVFPVVTFVTSAAGFNADQITMWQSGEIAVYVSLLLRWNQFWVFLPIISYSMICMASWTIRPALGTRWSVRIGIFAGAVLSGQFTIQVAIVTGGIVLVLASIVGVVLAVAVWLIGIGTRRTRRFSILEIMFITTIVAVIVAFIPISVLVGGPLEMLSTIGFCVVAAGAPLSFATFIRASIYLLSANQRSPRSVGIAAVLGIWLAWLFAWFVTWRIAIVRMQEAYSQLPTTAPDCFVCSAAASGHRSIVRSHEVNFPGGTYWLNAQMQRLKFLEFALTAGLPSLHCVLRKRYNLHAPPLARRCRKNRWLADLVFLALLPLELLSRSLAMLLRIPPHLVDSIYSANEKTHRK